MSTNRNFWRERRAEVVSNQGLSAYQPTALLLGQTGSQLCQLYSLMPIIHPYAVANYSPVWELRATAVDSCQTQQPHTKGKSWETPGAGCLPCVVACPDTSSEKRKCNSKNKYQTNKSEVNKILFWNVKGHPLATNVRDLNDP